MKIINNLIIILLLFTNLSSCKKSQSENATLRNVILVSPVAIGTSSTGYFSGVLEEGKSVNASFMADGRLTRVLVKEGDRISKGQLLAALDDTDYQIGVNQLRAQFNQMTEEKKRMDEMFNRHNIAPNDYEKFTTGYEQLKLQLEMAENKLGYTKLYAPSSGYIAEKYIEPGELVGAGTPIFKITDDSDLVVIADLPVNMFVNRKNIYNTFGYSATLPDYEIPLSVESFTPDPSNNMLYKMKLLVPSKFSKDLSPGMNMKVVIEMLNNGEEGFSVPSRAVFDEEGAKFIWVFNPVDSTIHKKPVTVTGNPIDSHLNITGLTGEELIVETGVKQLFENEKVNVSKSSDYGL